MRLYLDGCDRYAAEQALMTFFPGEKPEYEYRGCDDHIEFTVNQLLRKVNCVCTAYIGDAMATSYTARNYDPMASEAELERIKSYLIKLALYRVRLRLGLPELEWGCITGVRPVKLMSELLAEGLSSKRTIRKFEQLYFTSHARSAICCDAAVATAAVERELTPRSACLYVGIPFCPSRCAYCSFVSQSVEKSLRLVEPYLAALSREIVSTAAASERAGLKFEALYIGGGTPTTLTAEQLDELITQLERSFDLSGIREFTVEAGRPDTISAEKLEVLARHGVTRLSVNPQSLSDDVLKAIGRRHTAEDIVRAVDLVRKHGKFDLNMDLIAGLPGDTFEGFEASLSRVLALKPENVTVHTLAMKRGSRLTVEGSDAVLPESAEVEAMVNHSLKLLPNKRFKPYYLYRQKYMTAGCENIGWSRLGRENVYNICMMEELCSVVALGAGGSTKLVRKGDKMQRLFAPKYPNEYIESIDKITADKERIVEFYGV